MGTLILNGGDWSGAPTRPNDDSWEWTRLTRGEESWEWTRLTLGRPLRADWPERLWCVDLYASRRIGASKRHIGLSAWRA